MRSGLYIGVVGPAEASPEEERLAYRVGELSARGGGVVVCGGLAGVMEAACRGAVSAGGLTVGLLPQDRRGAGNRFLSVALPTGLGELRNGLIVRCSDALVAVGGSWGTLSEVALAVRTGTPIVALRPWQVADDHGVPRDGPAVARDVGEVVAFLDAV